MKASIELEIGREELNYELQNLVSQIASDEIKSMVKYKGEPLVEEELKQVISPIVDDYLKSAIVGKEHLSYHSTSIRQTDVDTYIKRTLQKYLDEPCYMYSKESTTLSGRYNKSSDKSSMTRAEYWIRDKVREYADKELYSYIDKKIEDVVKSVIPSNDEIEEIIKREIQNKFK